MDIGKSIILAAIIVAIGLLLSNGIYEFDTPKLGSVHRYNKLTGSVELSLIAPGNEVTAGWHKYGVYRGGRKAHLVPVEE